MPKSQLLLPLGNDDEDDDEAANWGGLRHPRRLPNGSNGYDRTNFHVRFDAPPNVVRW